MSHQLRRVGVVIIVAVLCFPVLLRGTIGFVHPKDGPLVELFFYVGGLQAAQWASEYIAYPSYDLLVHSVWHRPSLFVALWAAVAFVAATVALLSTRGRN